MNQEQSHGAESCCSIAQSQQPLMLQNTGPVPSSQMMRNTLIGLLDAQQRVDLGGQTNRLSPQDSSQPAPRMPVAAPGQSDTADIASAKHPASTSRFDSHSYNGQGNERVASGLPSDSPETHIGACVSQDPAESQQPSPEASTNLSRLQPAGSQVPQYRTSAEGMPLGEHGHSSSSPLLTPVGPPQAHTLVEEIADDKAALQSPELPKASCMKSHSLLEQSQAGSHPLTFNVCQEKPNEPPDLNV